jgi:hypothetical protein
LAGDAYHFPNPQPEIQYTFGLLAGQALVQVRVFVTDEGINWPDVTGLITVLAMAFRDPDHMATAD